MSTEFPSGGMKMFWNWIEAWLYIVNVLNATELFKLVNFLCKFQLIKKYA